MRVLARVDASPRIGFGHLARTSTLVDALEARGAQLTFASHAPSDAVRAWVEGLGAALAPLDGAPGSSDDLAATRALADGADLVVIDGYVFDAAFQASLRGAGRAVCVIDDLADAPVGGDVILNGNLYGDELTYDAPHATLALLGPAYALVRPEFAIARAERAARPHDAGRRARVLVTMGGADPTSETEKALDALDALGIQLDAKIVVGAANPRAADLTRRVKDLRAPGLRAEVVVGARNMGELMAWADVALTAAGSTCLELATVGVPGLTITVAANQRGVAAAFAFRGLLDHLGESETVTPTAIRDALATLLDDAPRRARTESALREAVDGRGAERAAEAIATHLGG
jgi:UDP-2,4-diacetamido-2,4,6-trideoxy-beta-L-altropyranose hydrolase